MYFKNKTQDNCHYTKTIKFKKACVYSTTTTQFVITGNVLPLLKHAN